MYKINEEMGSNDITIICVQNYYTVKPCYNRVLGTMKITLLYQVSHVRGVIYIIYITGINID